MGELVVSSEGGMELEMRETEADIEKKKEDGTLEANSSLVRWERFLPRMVLRVLLVEADDSTRQIIAALLRKCSYKVAAVSDGLKAWEVLKGRPHNIDLILTEVELPSISGFALLTLIMEHEICKNIPVIMMSSHDSVNTVYNCMLRGAADFLVKPVRKNELRNLWQHVWRRQASSGSLLVPLEESVAQQKVEATAENNAASDPSSGYMACIQRNRECIEKGSDAQSSCTKPDLEAEEAPMDHMDLSHPKWNRSLSGDMTIQNHEECTKSSNKLPRHASEAGGSMAAAGKDDNTINQGEDMDHDGQCKRAKTISSACENNHVLVNSSGGAIDLIGAFDNYHKSNYRSSGSHNNTNKADSSPLLDLSLRRSHPSGCVNQITDERHTLTHSDASAFSVYVNRALQPQHSTSPSICNQQKDHEASSNKNKSNHTFDYNSDTHGPTDSSPKNMIAVATGQLGQPEMSFPCPQQSSVLPVSVPVRGIRFENIHSAYGSLIPPIFCTQSGPSPLQSPGSARPQEPSFRMNPFHLTNPETQNPQQLYNLMDPKADNANEQTEHKQGHKFDSLEDRAHFSSATDQSASSSFCNGAVSRLNSIGCGSNGNVNPVPSIMDASECRNADSFVIQEGNSRSTQREAALNKFRLKRKERCYEKKVRYESRKKLAEQRPRVKGQFVRQMPTESLLA